MSLRAVFLDIGETVMRPKPSWEHVYAEVLREHGVEAPIDALHNALRRAYHHGGLGFSAGFEATEETSYRRTVEIDRAAFAELGIRDLPDAYFVALSRRFLEPATWEVFTDVVPSLDALHERGLRVGVLSNWVWQLPELLESIGIAGYFDAITVSSRVGYEKPHTEIFRAALRAVDVRADEAMHVGDHLDADVVGALAAGIGAVLIDRRGRHSDRDLPPNVPRVTDLGGLLPIVDARLAEDQPAVERSA